jgi:hypothetical protein
MQPRTTWRAGAKHSIQGLSLADKKNTIAAQMGLFPAKRTRCFIPGHVPE